jgi:hypothetical protein
MTNPFTESAAARLVARIDGAAAHADNGRPYHFTVTELRPVRPRTGWFHVAIAVRAGSAEPSRTPLAIGIVAGGGRMVMPWFELRIYPTVEMAGGTALDARAAGLESALIDSIGELIPPGGHLMIEYESPGQSETHAELLLRVPPAATHLGSMMFRAGFRGAFKDWYISEGGHEGPRKLQANKSPTLAAARAALAAHRGELSAFLKRPLPDKPTDAAAVRRSQVRARALLKQLRHG